MKCDHCPLKTEDRDCLGERNPAVCRNANPSSPTYRPGIIARLLNFAGAVVQHVAAGMPEAPPGVAAERLAICRECEHFDAEAQQCRLCTCSMPWKVTWADARCPDEPPRWGPVTSPSGP